MKLISTSKVIVHLLCLLLFSVVSKAQVETKREEARTGAVATLDREILIPEQKILCCGDSSLSLVAFTYPKSDADSFKIVIYTTSNVTKEKILSNQILDAEFLNQVEKELEVNCTNSDARNNIALYGRNIKDEIKKRRHEKEKKEKENAETLERLKVIESRIDNIAGEKDFAVLLESQKSIALKDEKGNMGAILEVDSIYIRVSNNTIYQMDIVGKIGGVPTQTISNNDYGLNLRSLIDGGQEMRFHIGDIPYKFCYKDVFFARPTSKGVISYELRDGEYHFYPDSIDGRSQKLHQKRLLDYVSASAFVDLPAFNSESPNKNLISELYFNYHINPFNIWKGVGLLKNAYLPVTFGVNLFKQGEGMETFRFSKILAIDSSRAQRDTVTANQYYFKNLDLLRYSFMQVRPMVNLLAIDIKKARTILELNGGFLLTGSNARLTDPVKGTDSVFSRSVYSYSWLLESRIRLNPRPHYGMDLHVLYSFGLRPFSPDMLSSTGIYTIKELGKANMLHLNNDDFIMGELNFFFDPSNHKSDTDKGGLYFKLNWYKSVHYADGHFMFLLGYSTDIKNFFR